MRGTGHGRLLRGSRPQGCGRSRSPRISDRRGAGRGADRHHQGERLGRRRHRGDVQGTAALRDTRSRAYITPDAVADFSRVTIRSRPRSCGRGRRDRARQAGDPEGLARIPRRLHRRGPDLLRGRGAVRAGPARRRRRPRPAGALRDCPRRHPVRPDWRRRAARRGDVDRGGGAVRSARARRGPSTVARGRGRIGDEVESLYTNGPAGGGGATRSVREVLAIASTFIPRALVRARCRSRSPDEAEAVAHSRSGDKGTISNISLIAFEPRTTRGWCDTSPRSE